MVFRAHLSPLALSQASDRILLKDPFQEAFLRSYAPCFCVRIAVQPL